MNFLILNMNYPVKKIYIYIYTYNPNIYNTNTVQLIYIYIYIRYIIENAIKEITNCIMRIGLATNVVILY